MTYPDPTLFGHDPWWLILAKALGIFVFLLLTVLSAILIERKVLGRMQMRPGPTGSGHGVCCSRWPTASNSPSRKASPRPVWTNPFICWPRSFR